MNRLLERLDYIRINPVDILNYGLHTDYSASQLMARYSSAVVTNLSDLSDLKNRADNSVDLVLAHFPLVAKADPIAILREFSRVLRDEGLLLLTSLGPDTLYELRESFLSVDNAPHVYDFYDMHHVGDWLKGLHFSDPVVDREVITIAYDHLSLFFQDLKQLHATNQLVNRSRGLLSKNRWEKMLLHYEQFKKEDYYPVTIELVFGHAWKVKQNNKDEFVISVDQIRRTPSP
jgi:malonyl-CoA O-methyltransferase